MADDAPKQPLSGDVKLPVIGPTSKRVILWGGVAVVVIVGAAYVYRGRRAKAGGDVAVVDPATGTAVGGAYVNPAPSRTVDSSINDQGLITTDDQWVNAVAPKLISAGWDAQFVYLVLGKYLAGQALTQDEASVIRAAWGLQGKPPSQREIILAQDTSQPGNTPSPTPAPTPAPAPPAEVIYTFKSGDTLGRVAALYGMSTWDLYNFGTNAASLEQYATEKGTAPFWPRAIVYPGYQIGVPVR